MAWTPPMTWSALQKVRAVLLNQQLRDNMLDLDARMGRRVELIGEGFRTSFDPDHSGLDDLGISATVTLDEDTKLWIVGHAYVAIDAEAGGFRGFIREDTTIWGFFGLGEFPAGFHAFEGSARITAGAGTHTYKLSGETTSGTGSYDVNNHLNAGFIDVFAVGPA